MPCTKKMRAKRERLVTAQDGKCFYCGSRFTANGGHRPTIDHVKPRFAGGSESEISNLVAACHSCNQEKGGMSAESFRASVRVRQEQAESLAAMLRRQTAAIGCDESQAVPATTK